MQPHQRHHVRQTPPGPHFRFNLPKVEIHIRRGVAKHPVRPVGTPVFLIGSADDCDLVLADAQIPDVFAYIYVSHDKVALRALGEGPEMTVNGHPISTAAVSDGAATVSDGAVAISDGDRVRTASYEFIIRVWWPAKNDSDDETEGQGSSPEESILPEDVRIGLGEIQSLLDLVRTLIDQEDCLLRVYSGPEALGAAAAKSASEEALFRWPA